MHTFTPEAFDRCYRTLGAGCVLREHAEAISHVTDGARDDELVVAVVEPDLTFGGAWIIARQRLVEQGPLLEAEGGWSFTFGPHTARADVERRCLQFVRIAYRRLEAMERRAERQRRG